MSAENRNTQFEGFAKALLDEVYDPIADYWREDTPEVIARRAYDLACHVVTHLDEDVAWRKGKGYSVGQIVENDVPDMTELPKEQSENE